MRRVIALVAVLMIGVAGVATAAVVFRTVHLEPGKCVIVKKANERVCANRAPIKTIVRTTTQWVTTTVPATITIPSTTAQTPGTTTTTSSPTTTTTSSPPPTTTTGTTTATPACVSFNYSGGNDGGDAIPSFTLAKTQTIVWTGDEGGHGSVGWMRIKNGGTSIVDTTFAHTASGGFDLGPGTYDSITVDGGYSWTLSTGGASC